MRGITEQQQGDSLVNLRRRARALIREVDHRESELKHSADIGRIRTEVKDTESEIEDLQAKVEEHCRSQARDRPFRQFKRKRLEHGWNKLQSRWGKLQVKVKEASKSERQSRTLQQLRTLRTEVMDVRSVVARVQSGKASLTTCLKFLDTCRTNVKHFLDTIEHGDPALKIDDDLCHLRDLWQQVECLVRGLSEKRSDNEHELPRLEVVDSLCHDMVVTIGWWTIPDRLNKWLDNAWPGTPISFHKVFEDELPELADRQRLLSFLSFAPEKLHGALVDPESGLIYKVPPGYKRWAWVILLALGFLGATAAVMAGGYGLLRDKIPGDWPNDLIAFWPSLGLWWIALCAGVLFHAAADNIKSARTLGTASASGFVMGHMTHWISAHINALGLRLATMMIGAFGAFALLKDQLLKSPTDLGTGSAIFTMFLVGYGLDSFVDIFVETADRRVAAQTASLKK